jgi:hypothetical protein
MRNCRGKLRRTKRAVFKATLFTDMFRKSVKKPRPVAAFYVENTVQTKD